MVSSESWRDGLGGNPCFLHGLGPNARRNRGVRGLLDHAQVVLWHLTCALGKPGGPFNLADDYRFNLVEGETIDEVVENAIGDIVREARTEALAHPLRPGQADDAVVELASVVRSLASITDRDELRAARTRLVSAFNAASVYASAGTDKAEVIGDRVAVDGATTSKDDPLPQPSERYQWACETFIADREVCWEILDVCVIKHFTSRGKGSRPRITKVVRDKLPKAPKRLRPYFELLQKEKLIAGHRNTGTWILKPGIELVNERRAALAVAAKEGVNHSLRIAAG